MKIGKVDRVGVSVGYTKLAVKREEGYPIGSPAPMFLNCLCGQKLHVDFPYGADVHCSCGKAFNARGWILNPEIRNV